MKHAKIIEGAYKDCFGPMDNLVHEDGSPNWHALMWADPGVQQCPKCSCYVWNEARVMECPDCTTIIQEK
jgi:hypothetical protein